MRMEMDWGRKAAAAALLAMLAACGGGEGGDGGVPKDSATAAPFDSAAQGRQQTSGTQPRNNLPAGPTTQLPPNELGRIMVLEYHRLGTPEGEWFRTLENFRKDLQALYQAGYRPVTMRQ